MKLKSFALTSLSVLSGAMIASAGDPVSAPMSPMPSSPAPATGGLVDEIGAEISFGYDSVYMFRGVDFGDSLLWTDVNLTLPLADSLELNVGAWYAGLADDDYTELDLYAGLTYNINDSFSVGVGYTHYYFPRSNADYGEVGATLGYSIAGVDLGLGYYYDFEVDGSYYELGASYEIALSDSVSLVPGAVVGFGDDYYGVSGGNQVGLTLGLPIKLTGTATLTPYVAYNLPIDSLDDAGEDDQVYGGVSLAVTF
ncbi:MAG: hypothetical protein R3F19_00590 [Verrucomicrobiales bacterium]